MLTAKENFLKCLRGEVPDYVPIYSMGVMFDGDGPPPDMLVEPRIIAEHRVRGGGPDCWGVEYVATESTSGALIPANDTFILDDITRWRDVIKAPDLTGIDWEKMCREDFEWRKLDRSKTAVCMNLHIGYFQTLMSFMGFTNGLCAMYEEPEEVKALFDYLCSFYCTVAEKYVDYCKPDVWTMMDDTAAWANPFISPDMYREFLIPLYDRQAKFGRDRGLPISMHNCGKSDVFFDDLVKIGVTMWDPAQTCNDLAGIKKKYGNKLVIAGGWDAQGRLLQDDATYEEIYESVKKQMDLLAPGGGYCFLGMFLANKGDTAAVKKNAMLYKAYNALRGNYY
jgi:hypothetical protein